MAATLGQGRRLKDRTIRADARGMLPKATYCRCGYASPAGAVRCLGCGRSAGFGRPAPAAAPVHHRHRQPHAPHAPRPPHRPQHQPLVLPIVPLGPIAIGALGAMAWLGPEEHRPQLLTLAALLGAALSANHPSTRPTPTAAAATPAPPPARPARRAGLTDDELRAAILAW
jgi:hypothetical protein